MNCPNCGKQLADNINMRINFCPLCGKQLFESGKEYIITIDCIGQRHDNDVNMMVFVDESILYNIAPGEKINIKLQAGFHMLRFRQKIRSKDIAILINSGYYIKAYYNTLSGLIETNVSKLDDEDSMDLNVEVATPDMVSEIGFEGFKAMLGEDDPDFEIRSTSGLNTGVLHVYSTRMEFKPDNSVNTDAVQFKDIVSIRKKMGAMDVQCAGNVHKIYSIPKDIYNELMVYLTNKIEEIKQGS